MSAERPSRAWPHSAGHPGRLCLLALALALASAAWAQGPTAHWPLDEAAGDRATDETGGLVLTLSGAEWAQSKLGPALHLDGGPERAVTDLSPALRPTEALTVSVWALTTSSEPYQMLADAGSGWGEDNQGWRLMIYQGGLRFMVAADGIINLVAGQVTVGQWHHVAATYDGAQAALYLDGELLRSVELTGPITYEGLSRFLVGCGGNGGLIGQLDDLAIYDRALSAEEIAALFQEGSGRRLTSEELLAARLAGQPRVRLARLPGGPAQRGRDTCLLASFDRPDSNDADFARVDPRAAGGRAGTDVPGRFGLGTRLEDGVVPIIFAGPDNLDMRHGTLEFWARSPEGRNVWSEPAGSVLLSVICEDQVGYPGRSGFNLILRRLADPVALELAVDSARQYWYSHLRPEFSGDGAGLRLALPCADLDPQSWHHFLVSWDASDGGRAWLLIDGEGVSGAMDPPLGEGPPIPCHKLYLGGGYFADLTTEFTGTVDDLHISDQCVARSRLADAAPEPALVAVDEPALMRAEELVRAWLDQLLALQLGGGWQCIFDWPTLIPTEAPGTYSVLAEDEYTVRYTMTAMLRGYEVLGDDRYLRSALQAGEMLVATQDEGGAWCQGYIVTPRGYEPVAPGGGEIQEGTQQDPIRFLCYLYRVTGDERYLQAAMRGGDFVLAAQKPDGAWPLGINSLTMEPSGGYSGFSTLNDGTTIWGMRTMLLVYQMTGEQRFLDALLRAGDFLIAAQQPAPTFSWAEQYGPDGRPGWAREWEPPAACTTATIYARDGLLLLYDLTGDDRYLEPLRRSLTFWEGLPAEHRGYRNYDIETGAPIDAHGYRIYHLGDPEFGVGSYMRSGDPAWGISSVLQARQNGPLVPLRGGSVPRAAVAADPVAAWAAARDPGRLLEGLQARALGGINAFEAWRRGELGGSGNIIADSARSGPLLNVGGGSAHALPVLDYLQCARAALRDLPVTDLSVWGDAEFAHVDPDKDWYATPMLAGMTTGVLVTPADSAARLAGEAQTIVLRLHNLTGAEISPAVTVTEAPDGLGVELPETRSIPAATTAELPIALRPAPEPTEGVLRLRVSWEGGARDLDLPVSSAPAGQGFLAEAEAATRIEPPLVVLEDATASGGRCLGTPRPADFSPAPVPAGARDAGAAVYEFDLARAGRYRVDVRTWWIDGGGNSLYTSVDGGEDAVVGNDDTLQTWGWVAGPTWELATGRHTLRIGNRELGARFDRVYLGPAP